MDKLETYKLLSIIKAVYPNFKMEDGERTLTAWQIFLSDYSYQDMQVALQIYVNTNGSAFAPSVSQLINTFHNSINLTSVNQMMSEQEAWQLVKKAISNGIYGSVEEFENLPPVLKKIVGSPSTLKAWAQEDAKEIDTVVASNVMRSYRAVQSQEEYMRKIPLEVRKRLQIGVDDE